MDGFAGEPGIRNEGAQGGHSRLAFDADERHLNVEGTLHGGVLATLVDTAMGLAVRSSIDGSDVPATTQLTIAYLTAARQGHLVVSARVLKQGDHVLFCDADIEQDGRAVVHALATFAVL